MSRSDFVRRLETLQAIADSVDRVRAALAARDLPRLQELTALRQELLEELKEVDTRIAETPPGRSLEVDRSVRSHAASLHRELVATEATLRSELAAWHEETRDALVAFRRCREARSRYAAHRDGRDAPPANDDGPTYEVEDDAAPRTAA